MTTAQGTAVALLRAVREDPADTLARLAYADWLDETGGDDGRAEFVRVQVALATPHAETAPYRCDHCDRLRRRERELLTPAAFRRWFAGFEGSWAGVRRGFVESVQLSTAHFLRHAPAFFGAQPITAVDLTDRGPSGGEDWRLWWRQDSGALALPPGDLPREIFRLIPRGPDDREEIYRAFRSEALARAALSRACVAWGRLGAGLPPPPA